MTAATELRERVQADGFTVSLLVDAEAPRIRLQGDIEGEHATLLFPDVSALRWWWLGYWCARHRGDPCPG